MDISKKQIQKLGKRIRDNLETPEDNELLINYRTLFEEPLVELNKRLTETINVADFKYVIAGRLKRIKSIKRKLRRPSSHNMDLSRMSDIAATRIIVDSTPSQQAVFDRVVEYFEIDKIKDKRNGNENYRAIHIYIRDEKDNIIELQIRTLLQQLWADESESYGEQSKQLQYNFLIDRAQKYLTNLSSYVNNIENNIKVDFDSLKDDLVFKERSPFKGKLSIIKNHFNKFKNKDNFNMFYIIVFDISTLELISEHEYFIEEKKLAIQRFNKLNNDLDEKKFDIIFLNTNLGKEALKITHPRFFI